MAALTSGPVAEAHKGVTWESPHHRVVVVDPAVGRGAVTNDVVVQAVPGREAEAARDIQRVGGQVGAALPIVDGFAAKVPGWTVDVVSTSSAIISLTLNRWG